MNSDIYGTTDSGRKLRIVQEMVPGREITLAHIIANPDDLLYEKLGMDSITGTIRSAIGIMTVMPGETAIIMADLGIKASGVRLEDVDRMSGSLIISGTVSEVEAAVSTILEYISDTLGYSVCEITRT